MSELEKLIAEANGMGLIMSLNQSHDLTWFCFLHTTDGRIPNTNEHCATPEAALDAALAEVRAK